MKKLLFLSGCLFFITMGFAQCDEMMSTAEMYYSKGDYDRAANTYRFILDEKICGENPKIIQEKYNECLELVKEHKAYSKCDNLEACNEYIAKYPNGKYIAEVKNKRDKFKNDATLISNNRKAEDEAYANCNTEEACQYYLRKYPNGRYVNQVKATLRRFEYDRKVKDDEDKAFGQCYTEEGCRDYLRQYPNGRYVSEVRGLIADFENERMAERSAYMKILWVEFENTDESNNAIRNMDNVLYSTDIKYITPKIEYDGLVNVKKHVTINYKIYRPNGELMKNSASPAGYTRSDSFWVKTGYYNTENLTGWGNKKGGVYSPGEYKFEIWYNGTKLYTTSFTVYERENALTIGGWRDALRLCSNNVTNRYSDSFYKGNKLDGSRTGLGICGWDYGEYYIGNWSGGDMNGLGMDLMSEGYVINNCPKCMYYVGRFSADMKNGEGSCYDKYGNLIYNGSFVNDKPIGTYPMTGYDSYKFECIEYGDGCYYVGETKNGKAEGKGMYIWSNGDLFYGGWLNGKREGKGVMMMYDGRISDGTWKNDVTQ